MKKTKISLYLDPAQLRLLDEIAITMHQRRALVLRDAINCHISAYLRSPRRFKDEVV
jgi:predicted transcriptional regulator